MSCSNINNAIYNNSADEAIIIFRQTLTLKISDKFVKAECRKRFTAPSNNVRNKMPNIILFWLFCYC